MKVVLDTSPLYIAQAGVARYVRGLLGGLRRAEIHELEIEELAWAVENFGYRQPRRALKTFWRELVWAKAIAPRSLERLAPDVFHSLSSWLVEPPRKMRHLVTLHDMALMRDPQRFRRWHRWSGMRRQHRIAEADRVLCISQFTADEAMALLGLEARKLAVVHNGCDFHPDGDYPERAPEGDWSAPFFLFVGSLEPGKNLALLREAWLRAEAEGSPLPRLAVVGARWQGVAREGPPPTNWRMLGRVCDQTLVWLYRRALGLVFPSRYEGFGLPPLEAMALGCPVVCSPVASIPEVVGDAACLCELSATAYLDTLRQLARDDAARVDLRAAGLARAKLFSWEKCARQTATLYTELAG